MDLIGCHPTSLANSTLWTKIQKRPTCNLTRTWIMKSYTYRPFGQLIGSLYIYWGHLGTFQISFGMILNSSGSPGCALCCPGALWGGSEVRDEFSIFLMGGELSTSVYRDNIWPTGKILKKKWSKTYVCFLSNVNHMSFLSSMGASQPSATPHIAHQNKKLSTIWKVLWALKYCK